MIESDLINNNFLVFLLLNIHLKISFSKNLKVVNSPYWDGRGSGRSGVKLKYSLKSNDTTSIIHYVQVFSFDETAVGCDSFCIIYFILKHYYTFKLQYACCATFSQDILTL